MENQDEERIYRQKIMKVAVSSVGLCLLVAYWYATQSVAADCEYHPFLGQNFYHIYPPYKYYVWQNTDFIANGIPNILHEYFFYPYLGFFIGAGITFFYAKSLKNETSHGSAKFATKKEIDDAGLGMYEGKKEIKKSGVVVGVNPYTNKLMLHNGVEHIFLVAPTRSGKGVNTIIPTGLVWQHSIFFFDVKGELWQATAGYRQKILRQKVLKFAPLESDGSSARWNPLAEINYRTSEELSDVVTIVNIMVRPDGEKQGGSDPFWENSASALLNGVIMHLMYKHHKEGLSLPCPTNIMSFLSSPDMDLDELFVSMKDYPHISPEEFLELPDENGIPRKNPLKEIYGDYILNLKPFSDALGVTVKSIDDIRNALLEKYKDKLDKIPWSAPPPKKKNGAEDEQEYDDEDEDDEMPVSDETAGFNDNEKFSPQDDESENSDIEDCWAKLKRDNDKKKTEKEKTESPFYMLLVHPKVAECAANMLNGAEQTRASIMQTAQTAMALYQNPVIQKNTAVSDFCISDLLSPNDTVSLYLCMKSNEVQTVKPLSRLLINTMLQKLIREIKFDSSGGAKMKQRLLLMLDEFPQLGNLKSVELALAVCAGYGIKICIVAQDVNQLNKEYTKDNSIGSNCHIHIYFTPNLDSGGATAESISKSLGKKTITTVSHSDGGGLGKGSNSESFTGRELMTPDEVSHMSSERELVFVAGHRPIFGKKLRYYLQPFFLDRLHEYQCAYMKEHNYQKFCKRYPNGTVENCGGGNLCDECKKNNPISIKCPEYPLFSDSVTVVTDYSTLFNVHGADSDDLIKRTNLIRSEKEFSLSKNKKGGVLIEKIPSE